MPPNDATTRRFQNVLDHIDAHPDGDLSLAALAGVAAFSVFHFQRQFSGRFGVRVSTIVHLARIKRAAHQLAFRVDTPITDIALASGYDTPESFSRASRKTVGQSPSEFRAAPDWGDWQRRIDPLTTLRKRHVPTPDRSDDVRLLAMPDIAVALLVHEGDHARLGDSLRRFIAWRKQAGLPPSSSATYNLLYDDPDDTPSDQHRFGLAVATTRPIPANDAGIVAAVMPGGRWAVLRHVGPDETLFAAVHWLYSTWLPASGETPRDFPLMLQRLSFFPDVTEAGATTDILLPLAG